MANIIYDYILGRLRLSDYAGPPPIPSVYIHTQTTASTTWTIDHYLGYKGNTVNAFKNNGDRVEANKITYPTINQTIAIFPSAISGTARVS